MSTLYLNVNGRDVCPHCEPGKASASGLVIVSTRADDGMAEYGPCPHCEAGARAEARYWPEGYWQGRPPDLPRPKPVQERPRLPFSKRDEFVDIPAGGVVELSLRENYLRSLLLLARYEGETVNPAVGIDVLSGDRRRALVERELTKVKRRES